MKGYVYFIQAGEGPVKIGWALDPKKRLAELQTGCPSELRLIGTWPGDRELEKSAHQHFAEHRLRGEWFRPTRDVLAASSMLEGYRPRAVEPRPTEADVVYWAEIAAHRLLLKFHSETECGQDGLHWAECDALADAFGYDSWDIWTLVAETRFLVDPELLGKAA